MGMGQAGKVCVLSAALALGVGAAGAQAQTIELKLSHFVPPNHTFHKWATAWAEQLAKESGGRLKFTIYPNGQLVGPPNRQLDAARNAIIDMAFVLHGVTPGRYPMTELGNLPFTWPKAGSGSATTSQRMSELAPTYLAKEHQGLHILCMAVANPVVFYSKSPIRKLDDFKGVKIRYAGVQNKYLIDALGAVPLLVPPPESQDALAKGIVDARHVPARGGARLRSRLGRQVRDRARRRHRDLRVGDEPGEVQFAAGRPQGADRQDHRPGGRRGVSARPGRRRRTHGRDQLIAQGRADHHAVRRRPRRR